MLHVTKPCSARCQGQECLQLWMTGLHHSQALVLRAVLPLWSDPALAAFSPQLAQLVIDILTNCTDGAAVTTAAAAVRAGPRPLHQPDPAVVQQIVEMGFTQPRAEEALRRVGLRTNCLCRGAESKYEQAHADETAVQVQHNSVELAMEWLINHPEEAAAPARSAAATAPQSAEEAELTKNLSGFLYADSAISAV